MIRTAATLILSSSLLLGASSSAQEDGIDLGTPQMDMDAELHSSFNFSDLYLGLHLGVADRENLWSLTAFFDARPFTKKVLIQRPDAYYQFHEWRGMVGFQLDKAFLFWEMSKRNGGVYLEGQAAYSFGDFRASRIRPTPGWLFIPGGGIAFSGTKDNLFKIGVQWADIPHRKSIPPFRFKIGSSISLGI